MFDLLSNCVNLRVSSLSFVTSTCIVDHGCRKCSASCHIQSTHYTFQIQYTITHNDTETMNLKELFLNHSHGHAHQGCQHLKFLVWSSNIGCVGHLCEFKLFILELRNFNELLVCYTHAHTNTKKELIHHFHAH